MEFAILLQQIIGVLERIPGWLRTAQSLQEIQNSRPLTPEELQKGRDLQKELIAIMESTP